MSNKKYRINCLIDLVPKETETLWDLCCDHGQIGLGYFAKFQDRSVIFVDQIASITQSLEHKTKLISTQKLEVLCESATTTNYNRAGINTYLIAGVGGELAAKILSRIDSTLENDRSFILISAHNHMDIVREHALKLGYKGTRELIFKERNQFYEMILLNKNSGFDIHPFGSFQWKSENGQAYLKHQISFLEKKIKHQKTNTDHLQKKMIHLKSYLK